MPRMLSTTAAVFALIIYSFLCISDGNSVRRITDEFKQFKLQMKGYSPRQVDDYVAISVKTEPGYIVKFEPFASAERVHHMLLYGCQQPAMTSEFWQGGMTCSGSTHILYAWARNAPALELPKNVAFSVGNEKDVVRYFVLQIHYAKPFRGNVRDFSGVIMHMSNRRPKYLADVLLFVSGQPIPPHQPAFLNNMSCTYNSDVLLHPFAFRVHTHAMGRVVSAYVRHTDEETATTTWTRIGKRNPQWPQLFQPVENSNLTIHKNDFFAATCRFDSSDKDVAVPMGSMGVDEMCNFYMMFYRDADQPDPFAYGGFCGGDENPAAVAAGYPVDGTTLLPRHVEWEHTAHQSTQPFGVTERAKLTRIGDVSLGQVSGLAFDNRGRLVVFHRGSITWRYDTFDSDNILTDKVPIKGPTVLVAEVDDAGKKIRLVGKYGHSLFHMPHSIFVDESNYYYTTDVGSHQVIKWEIMNGELHPVWTLGERFVPGSDTSHFCKPAGVAVSRIDGSVYVADGYCNSRVMKFSKDGTFITQWGVSSRQREVHNKPLGSFNLPHDITLDEHGRRVFVVDRENGRVQAFTEQGDPLFDVSNPLFFETVYSAHYCADHGLVFIPGASQNIAELNAYVVPPNASQIEYAFRPTSGKFERPHVIRVRGNAVWVGEIAESGGVLWWLRIEAEEMMETAAADRLLGSMPMAGGMPVGSISHTGVTWRDSNVGKQAVNEHFWTSIALALLLISAFYGCFYYCFCRENSNGSIFRYIFCCCRRQDDAKGNIDRKGFLPLRNLDDDDEDESDIDGEYRSVMKPPHLLAG